MKTTIVTQNLQRWRWIDRLAWLIPFVVGGLLIHGGVASTFGDVLKNDSSPQTATVYILVFLTVDLIFAAPCIFLWRAVSRQIKKGYLQRATIPLVQELDYYRDKLTGLSPTVISMLVDLHIEPEKDAAALILKYELMGVAIMEGDKLVVKNPNHPELRPSDRALLELLATRGLNTPGGVTANPTWLKLARQEAEETPFFRRSGPQIGCFISGCVAPFIYFISVMILVFFSTRFGWYRYFEETLATMKDDTMLIHTLQADPLFLRQALLYLLVALLLGIALFLPLISLVRGAAMIFNLYQGGIKRTPYGERVAEYVYGMKNFLHDFSNLSEADQQSLILWDDFLIYAVILEENKRIADQIVRKRKQHKSF